MNAPSIITLTRKTARVLVLIAVCALMLPGQFRPVSALGMRVFQKTCEACGRVVSLSSRVGGQCPYCGAYWSYERATYRSGASQPEAKPQPVGRAAHTSRLRHDLVLKPSKRKTWPQFMHGLFDFNTITFENHGPGVWIGLRSGL